MESVKVNGVVLGFLFFKFHIFSKSLAKKFTLDIDFGYKDAAHTQNDLLYICFFTDFACCKDT